MALSCRHRRSRRHVNIAVVVVIVVVMGTATDVLVQQCKSIELLRDVEGGAPCCLGGRRRQGARVSIADFAAADASSPGRGSAALAPTTLGATGSA